METSTPPHAPGEERAQSAMVVDSGASMKHLSAVDVILSRASPFGNETGSLPSGEFYPGQETRDFISSQARILVIGAGGLGCELLKNLALSGFKSIDVIDLDTIDVTNLNRQFLFRQKDVGRMKAEVAAEFIKTRVPGVQVTAHTCPIQDKDETFYRQFSLVIAGLDNIKARRWMNSLLHQMVETDDEGNIDPETVIPLIDGGTEAFKGQARVILPMATSCFECSIDSFPPQVHFPLCTVAETPRKPEHCIAYVLFAINKSLSNPEADRIHEGFVEKFGVGTKLDKDDPGHMRFIYELALDRANLFSIEGVTYMLTMGVVKNIVPAVASTNAIIAGACVNEAFKVLSWSSQSLNTYFMYNGTTGVYSYTFEYGRKADCPVCNADEIRWSLSAEQTLSEFMDRLMSDTTLQLEKPSIAKPGLSLFIQKPEALRKQTEPNLQKKLGDLLQSGDVITVTDPVFPAGQNVSIIVNLE